jgi:aldehyde:ferredoxin oxidoreductase
MGLDTISAGSALAFATECYEGGLISSSETDGIELGWGDAEAMVLMLEKMAKREGFGQVLADGVKAAAERIGAGAQEYAVHCSGQEPGMHDPKYWPGIVLAYHLDATPGRHGQGGHWMEGFPDWWKESLGVQELPAGPAKYDYAGKGEVFKRAACMLHFIHSSGLCRFPWYHMDPASMWEFVSAVTGWRIGREDAYRTGERIANIRHAFNIREGINPLARRPHRRLVGQPPLEEGPTKGVVLHTGVLFEDFLGAMEWNPENARPNERRLTELGLQDVAEDVC